LFFPAEETIELTASDAVVSDAIQHDYKTAPGVGPMVSHLSEEAVHALLSERLRCMFEGDTERRQLVDKQLVQANVEIDDISKEWRADRVKDFKTSRWSFSRARISADRSRNDSYRELDEGDTRHDYRLFADAGLNTSTLTEDEIHNLLTERYICRRNRNYERSDSIRAELESHGVYVDDKNKKWRADGLKFVHQSHNYKMAKDSGPFTATISEGEIHKVLAKRQYCRINQDFDKEDQILKYLERCGVSVDDMKFEWRADGVRFAQLRHKYVLSPDAGPSQSSMTEAEIHKHLAKHWRYKSLGGFTNTVNWISNVLADAGVFLDEESNEWRADGVRHNYRLSAGAGPNTSSLSEGEIHMLLEKRMRFRWRQQIRNSDEILDHLENAGVFVDDSNKEWRADSIDYFQRNQYKLCADAGPNRSAMNQSNIHNLLSQRWHFLMARDFAEADRLTNELFIAGVYVNDLTREWRADGKTCNFKLISGAGPIISSLSEDNIHLLLETSFHHVMKQNFVAAEDIQRQLLAAGVHIDLENNRWRADGIFHHYRLCPLAGPISSDLSVDEIHKFLEERWKYKVSHSENTNRIPDELLRDDDLMEWRADGIFHAYRECSDSGPFIATLKEDVIHDLLGTRLLLIQRSELAEADRILDILRENNVFLDDKSKEWRGDGVATLKGIKTQQLLSTGMRHENNIEVAKPCPENYSLVDEKIKVRHGGCFYSNYRFLSHDYQLSRDAGPIASPLAVDEINELLAGLHQTQLDGDFDEATHLLTILRRAGVYINEKKKEWRADGLEYGEGMHNVDVSILSRRLFSCSSCLISLFYLSPTSTFRIQYDQRCLLMHIVYS
jgi:cysteinyl-tRNA synthetase